jgi:hypothetical protein
MSFKFHNLGTSNNRMQVQGAASAQIAKGGAATMVTRSSLQFARQFRMTLMCAIVGWWSDSSFFVVVYFPLRLSTTSWNLSSSPRVLFVPRPFLSSDGLRQPSVSSDHHASNWGHRFVLHWVRNSAGSSGACAGVTNPSRFPWYFEGKKYKHSWQRCSANFYFS